MKLVIIGAPGSGKGTQASRIEKDFDIVHISMGNLLREAVAKKTPEGLIAKDLIEAGKLVDDKIIFDMLNRRIALADCENGFLLDGVPRNLAQIEFVEKLGIDKVVYIDVDFNSIIKRLTSRKSCRGCGGTFINTECANGLCPVCGAEVYTRDDDRKEVIEKRLETYVKQTAPVVEFYRKQGKLLTINGNQSIDDVYNDIKKALKNG